ncbi:MAG TPA: flagellar biosynthesis anti-sigma factor FlgM [Oscillospiraceae bacterium]|nr:flagellar biosynthesis anti-sigma factor FlgM [Oscillospiraceae bacterium]
MMIKNTGFSLIGPSGNYPAKKLDKTDFACRAAESGSSFASQVAAARSNPVDKIEISQHPVDNRPVLSECRNEIVSQINQDTDADRIETLKQQINGNQYSINAAEIAKIMLLN